MLYFFSEIIKQKAKMQRLPTDSPKAPARYVGRPRDPTPQDMDLALRQSGGDTFKFWQKLSEICYAEEHVESASPAPPSIMLPPGSVVVPPHGGAVRITEDKPIDVPQDLQDTPRKVVHIRPTNPLRPVSDEDVSALTKLARHRYGDCTVIIHPPKPPTATSNVKETCALM
jgi:hypothetical protein